MLGEQFKIDYKSAVANGANVIKGNKYRFTILTERLIRLEYSEDGIFEDRPTELIWHRDTKPVAFTKKEDARYLEITTKYFRLTYIKEKPFKGTMLNATANLKIELLNTDRVWFYGNKEATEARNYGAPGFSLDDTTKLKMRMGLYSPFGYAYIDDSEGLIASEDGTFINRDVAGLDLYVFMYLKDFAQCLQDYYTVTGYPALIPRYALGNWWSRNIPYNDETLKNLLDTFEQKKVPLSVVLLDKDWHKRVIDDKIYDSGFTWNDSLFDSPKAMIDYMHAKGIRLGLNVNPKEGFYPYEQNYNDLKKYISEENNHLPFNALDSKSLDIYLKLLIHPLDKYGVDFYWIDWTDKKDSNELFLLNHYHFYDMKKDYQRRAMILTRNQG